MDQCSTYALWGCQANEVKKDNLGKLALSTGTSPLLRVGGNDHFGTFVLVTERIIPPRTGFR